MAAVNTTMLYYPCLFAFLLILAEFILLCSALFIAFDLGYLQGYRLNITVIRPSDGY
jgi:hypothetical protein